MSMLTACDARPAFSATVDLTRRSDTVRYARNAVRAFVEEHGLPEHRDCPGAHDAAHSALLVVSELVTNACVHAGGPLEMCLGLYGGKLFIEVCDDSRAVPGVVDAGERGTEGGFGLGVVLAVADHWSVVRTSWGKRITVLLPLSC
ncbi:MULTISPECIES: ATP-binding protein [unclassified Streptomyces]|uniref:ATP-binding protein n=1 Tax=unclassified Streptomyces TaxID=2593676 RepID=UPI00344EA46E